LTSSLVAVRCRARIEARPGSAAGHAGAIALLVATVHAKNYSLLLAADQVRLAPLYDIASALPYGAHERKLRFAMKIGADYQVFPRTTRGSPRP